MEVFHTVMVLKYYPYNTTINLKQITCPGIGPGPGLGPTVGGTPGPGVTGGRTGGQLGPKHGWGSGPTGPGGGHLGQVPPAGRGARYPIQQHPFKVNCYIFLFSLIIKRTTD